MPKPRVGEKEGEFMPRCMRWMMEEEGVRDEKHAYMKCKGIWEQFKDRGEGRGKKWKR